MFSVFSKVVHVLTGTEQYEPEIRSPVPHLLASNDPPSEEEVHGIEKHVLWADRQLTLEDNSSTPNEHRIDNLESIIATHEAILHPARRIPTEILQLIFQAYVPQEDLAHEWAYAYAVNVPWALAQVCRRWRNTAIAMSEIWTTFPHIHFERLQPSSISPHLLPVVSELLHRSGTQPINFCIGFDGYNTIGSREPLHPAITLLIKHSQRWRHVRIKARFDTLLDQFGSIQDRLPNLRSLELCGNHGPFTVARATMFKSAPRLQYITLSGTLLSVEDIDFPWSAIREYKDEIDTQATDSRFALQRVMQEAKNLQSLCIVDNNVRLSFRPSAPIIIPTLRSLGVRETGTRGLNANGTTICLISYLRFYQFPSLRELTITTDRIPLELSQWNNEHNPLYFPLGALLPTFSSVQGPRTPCQLKTLRIRTLDFEDDDISLKSILDLLPELEELFIPLPPFSDLADIVSGAGQQLKTCVFTSNGPAAERVDWKEKAAILNELGRQRRNHTDSSSTASSRFDRLGLTSAGHRQAQEDAKLLEYLNDPGAQDKYKQIVQELKDLSCRLWASGLPSVRESLTAALDRIEDDLANGKVHARDLALTGLADFFFESVLQDALWNAVSNDQSSGTELETQIMRVEQALKKRISEESWHRYWEVVEHTVFYRPMLS